MLHVAFITSEYPHPKINTSVGGIGSFTKNLAESLCEKGCLVSVFLYSQNKQEVLKKNNLTVHLIKKKKVKGLSWWFNRKHIQNYINAIVKEQKIDIIEAPDWTGITAFMKFKVPLVIRLHGSDAFFCDLEGRKQKIKNFYFEKIALTKSDQIIGVSEFVVNKTKEIFKIKQNINTIYNAIDINKFRPNHDEVCLNEILYFGTIIRKKGIFEIVKIFKNLIKLKPNIELTIIGKDTIDIVEKKSTIGLLKKEISKEVQKKIKIINHLSQDSLKKHIEKSSIIILPSLAESFGLVTVEAMAMEKVVVASNYEWNREIIKDGISGVLIDPKNSIESSKKIISLIENKELLNKISNRARKRIKEKFSINNVIKENIELYKSILNK